MLSSVNSAGNIRADNGVGILTFCTYRCIGASKIKTNKAMCKTDKILAKGTSMSNVYTECWLFMCVCMKYLYVYTIWMVYMCVCTCVPISKRPARTIYGVNEVKYLYVYVIYIDGACVYVHVCLYVNDQQ